ncbi:hypothetical protein RCO48_24685 [Peribacillus frigoritolerans]|nr:hypothetical protein [Peribacillus frigoritolerans]
MTMSSYFIESAQEQHSMFKDLSFSTKALEKKTSLLYTDFGQYRFHFL